MVQKTALACALSALAWAWAGQALAETIQLQCRQEASDVYSMTRSVMMRLTYPDPVDVVIALDTETDRATLDQTAGLFSVGDERVLIMVVSDAIKEVWDIDRATGRALVMAYLVDEPRTVFIRREAQCALPDGMGL